MEEETAEMYRDAGPSTPVHADCFCAVIAEEDQASEHVIEPVEEQVGEQVEGQVMANGSLC